MGTAIIGLKCNNSDFKLSSPSEKLGDLCEFFGGIAKDSKAGLDDDGALTSRGVVICKKVFWTVVLTRLMEAVTDLIILYFDELELELELDDIVMTLN